MLRKHTLLVTAFLFQFYKNSHNHHTQYKKTQIFAFTLPLSILRTRILLLQEEKVYCLAVSSSWLAEPKHIFRLYCSISNHHHQTYTEHKQVGVCRSTSSLPDSYTYIIHSDTENFTLFKNSVLCIIYFIYTMFSILIFITHRCFVHIRT
jgi:hypothetical protein